MIGCEPKNQKRKKKKSYALKKDWTMCSKFVTRYRRNTQHNFGMEGGGPIRLSNNAKIIIFTSIMNSIFIVQAQRVMD